MKDETVKHLTMDAKKKSWVECNCDLSKDHYHSKKEIEEKAKPVEIDEEQEENLE